MKLLNEMVIKGSPSTRTAQQKGASVIRGHIVFYEKKEVTRAKDDLKSFIMPLAPDVPYEGSLKVKILWLFDKKSLTKKEDNSFHTKKVDLDNLAKGCLDCFTDCGYWNDDSQIAELNLTKGWSRTNAGLYVQIWELEEGDFLEHLRRWRESL